MSSHVTPSPSREPPARSEYSPNQDQEPGMQLEPPGVAPDGDEGEDKAGTVASATPTPPNPLARHLAILGLLIFASIWGTLTREGLVALNTYSGQSITPVIWAQAVGCLVMGWTVANKDALERVYPPLFIMLGTGYCGSVTTFSTWVLDVFIAYSNQQHWDRHGLHNVMDALTQTGATLGLSLAALSAGKTLGKWASVAVITRRFQRKRAHEPTHMATTTTTTTRLDLVIFAALGLGFWLGAALLAGLPPHANFRPTTFSIVFSPPGAILRWYLSRLNSLPRSKARRPYWPLGTFAANIFATAVVAALFVSQHVGRPSDPSGPHGAQTRTTCQVLYGLQEGFCGCLSTISTFAVELSSIKPRRRAVGYAVGSYAIGVALCVIIIGGSWWSVGMEGSCSLA